MRAVRLVLFWTLALLWARASCGESVYTALYESHANRVAGGNAWISGSPATGALNSDGDECDTVMNLSASQRCEFVKNTPDCVSDEGFINYPRITFCLFLPNLLPLVITLYVRTVCCIHTVYFTQLAKHHTESSCVWECCRRVIPFTHLVQLTAILVLLSLFQQVLWLFVLFLVLGLIASDLGVQCLWILFTVVVFLNDGVKQGVTFLAFGNGAPDVFSAMAAFSHPQTAGLAVGALFGAGIFVTTVVAGSIALVKPFTVASRPFLRDVIFYMVAVFWTFTILYKGHITLGETVGYLGLYIVYVLAVIVSAYIYSRQKHQLNGSLENSDRGQEVVLVLTVPVVDTDKEDHNWKRPLNCLHIITGPLVCVLTFKSGEYGLYLIEGELPVWVLIACIGAFLSGIVFFTTTNEHPPPYHFV
ncbi:Mitochondrial sodium/calcium exchanger protein [Triplophysa tibetana]|uniref:Mitochondrial sodium/calcium exchanger protein n=1 Tax=Triplophysa tibetana TaxID=1572043 RepID=A0A5A9PNP2_9TELE|nr:Mitochondrial sodium/calcium exchanger protein [Triplophysa tibetana]